MRALDRDYLRIADSAGLLRTLDGRPYVAGARPDPITGRPRVLVGYADPVLLSCARLNRRLLAGLGAAHPGVGVAVLRTPAGARPPEPWRRLTTYVRFDGEPPPPGDGVLRAGPEHDPLVRAWLVRAFAPAGDGTGDAARAPDPAGTAADALLGAPGRITLLHAGPDGPDGHATLLTGTVDEVTGEESAELVDVLVEPRPGQRAALDGLIAAAIAAATAGGTALTGHVVHRPGSDEHGARVLTSLVRHGWTPTHQYWRAEL